MRAAALATAVLAAAWGHGPDAAAGEPDGRAAERAAPSAEGFDGNRAMGTGEPRIPEPFTLELRFLQAARDGDRAAIERCLELGVDVGSRDDLGRSALLLAARDAGSLELVQLLRERGADPDAADVAGRTPLSFAAERGRLDIVRALAEQGAAVDRPDRQGRTPLFYAVLGDQPDVAVFLLDAGSDVDARDRFGDTPLMAACAKGHAAMAERLLARGADPSLRDQEGRTARDRAAPGAGPCRAPPGATPGAP